MREGFDRKRDYRGKITVKLSARPTSPDDDSGKSRHCGVRRAAPSRRERFLPALLNTT